MSTQPASFFEDLSESEINEIKAQAVKENYQQGELVFSEGDQVDCFYIVESGSVSIFFDKNGQQEEICVSKAGECFGEMAIFNQDRRSASVSAIEDSEILSIDKDKFLDFVKTQPKLAEKINSILAVRNEELILRENLIDTTGVKGNKLHVSIKGDPSLRESAFDRERYESVVDKELPELQKTIEELLFNRCVYQLFIGFNSGEIRTHSVFDPFAEEIHTANKLTNKAYIDRHFPKISYEEKARLVKSLYSFIENDEHFSNLPDYWQNIFKKSHSNWQPLNKKDICGVITKLTDLREIPNFYLRNFSISMIQDAIRMQFNCDGTHIVSADDYQRFLEENLV